MTSANDPQNSLHLKRWFAPAVVSVSLLALASGFAQFGVSATLGDVAKRFGTVGSGGGMHQVALSSTELGIGLAIVRLASLAALPLTALADRYGRKRLLLSTSALGLALTAFGALSPTYWWFVVVFALGRPLFSASTALAQVSAAEHTASNDRAKAIALVTVMYSIGAGLSAIINALLGGVLTFRGIFAFALLPLAMLPLLARNITETDRFLQKDELATRSAPVLRLLHTSLRKRFIVVCALTFALSVVTGPADSFVFLFAQNIRHLSGTVIATMVAFAGVVGFLGILLGRWCADNFGRRPTCTLAMSLMIVFATLIYSNWKDGIVVGYLLLILATSIFAPAAGALTNELFPTSVRASVAGWQVVAGVLGAVVGILLFGALTGSKDDYQIPAIVTFCPMLLLVGLFWLLPETKGHEPEELINKSDL